jgi:hypothetical protein
MLVWRGRSAFLATRGFESRHILCRRLLVDRLNQIRPESLKTLADVLGLSSIYGQTSASYFTGLASRAQKNIASRLTSTLHRLVGAWFASN